LEVTRPAASPGSVSRQGGTLSHLCLHVPNKPKDSSANDGCAGGRTATAHSGRARQNGNNNVPRRARKCRSPGDLEEPDSRQGSSAAPCASQEKRADDSSAVGRGLLMTAYSFMISLPDSRQGRSLHHGSCIITFWPCQERI
ncbi:hypothetical protein Z043_111052, partial [Scleropages formosus]